MIKIRNFLLRKQEGIGLLELLLALAIIAILLIMATRYYLTTSRSQKVNETISVVQSITSAAGDYFNSKGALDASGLQTYIVDAKAIPSNYLTDGDSDPILTAWGGTNTIAFTGTGTNTLVLDITTPSSEDANFLANRLGTSSVISGQNVTYTTYVGAGS